MPRMASGKTLPCFAPFDAGARSGGFIGDRFLSGLRPQVRHVSDMSISMAVQPALRILFGLESAVIMPPQSCLAFRSMSGCLLRTSRSHQP